MAEQRLTIESSQSNHAFTVSDQTSIVYALSVPREEDFEVEIVSGTATILEPQQGMYPIHVIETKDVNIEVQAGAEGQLQDEEVRTHTTTG